MNALSPNQRNAARHVGRTHAAGGWARARTSGERVSLASLARRGVLIRRPWRGEEGDPDAAYEYRLSPAIELELREKSPATWSTWERRARIRERLGLGAGDGRV